VDVVGAIEFADGIALCPRPNVVPGVPFVLYILAARHSIQWCFPPATGQQGDFRRNVLRASKPDKLMPRFKWQFQLTDKPGLSFPTGVLQHLQLPELRPSQQQPNQPDVRANQRKRSRAAWAPVALTEASTRPVISAVLDRCSQRLSFSFGYQTIRSGALRRTSRVLPCDKPGACARAKEGRALRRLRAASFYT
jgi:hypothetical protein